MLVATDIAYGQQQHKKSSSHHHSKKTVKKPTHYYPPKPKPSVTSKLEKLTPEEAVLFNKIEEMDSILVSDSVVRYYRLENNKLVNFNNELYFARDSMGMMDGTYSDDEGKEVLATIDYHLSYTPLDSGNTIVTCINNINNGMVTDYTTIVCFNGKVLQTSRSCDNGRCRTILKDGSIVIYEKDE